MSEPAAKVMRFELDARAIDAMIVILDRATHALQQTNPAEVIHTAAIVQKLVMIVAIARLRVLANAEVVQIAPVAGLLMTAKSVHVVALAKSGSMF